MKCICGTCKESVVEFEWISGGAYITNWYVCAPDDIQKTFLEGAYISNINYNYGDQDVMVVDNVDFETVPILYK